VGSFELYPYPRLQPGYYQSFSEPMSAYKCSSEAACPGGDPESCAQGNTGLACGECKEGYTMTKIGACDECEMLFKAGILFPILPLFVPPVLIRLVSSPSDVQNWGAPRRGAAPLAYIFFSGIQIIGLSSLVNIRMPQGDSGAGFEGLRRGLEPVLDLLSMLRPECTFGDDSSFRIIVKMFMPIYLVVIVALTYAMCSMIPKLRINKYVAVSTLGMLYVTFFLTLTDAAMTVFQCYPHPNGKSSTLKEPEILCYEGTWTTLAAIGVSSLLLFCGGVLGLFIYLLRLMPTRWQDHNFRMATKFLSIKFRFGFSFWALILMSKGLWLNLATVIFSKAHHQLLWIVGGLSAYSIGTMALLPWRHHFVNFIDATVHVILAYIFLAASFYADLTKQEKDELNLATLLISIAMMLVCGGGFCYVGWQVWKPPQLSKEDIVESGQVFLAFSKQPAAATAMLGLVASYESRVVMQAASIIKRESDGDRRIKCITSSGTPVVCEEADNVEARAAGVNEVVV
jgi:hypothetical protein